MSSLCGCEYSEIYYDESQEKIATLQKDNDTLNTDLKEAEGAVADLMMVNDKLTAEVEAQAKYITQLMEFDELKELLENFQ